MYGNYLAPSVLWYLIWTSLVQNQSDYSWQSTATDPLAVKGTKLHIASHCTSQRKLPSLQANNQHLNKWPLKHHTGEKTHTILRPILKVKLKNKHPLTKRHSSQAPVTTVTVKKTHTQHNNWYFSNAASVCVCFEAISDRPSNFPPKNPTWKSTQAIQKAPSLLNLNIVKVASNRPSWEKERQTNY